MKTIRQIQPDEWMLLKSLRLKALAESPQAYTETLEKAKRTSDSRWKALAKQHSEGKDSICALAFQDNETIGMAVGFLDQDDRSKAHIVSMWVHPNFRGIDIAKGLVRFVADWACSKEANVLAAGLTVENLRAQAFYQKLGFEFLQNSGAWYPDQGKAGISFKRILTIKEGKNLLFQPFLQGEDMDEIWEKRKDPREQCFVAVNFAFEDKFYTEFIRNISKGGLFIESNEQIPVGRALILAYHSPQEGPAKRIGQVVRTDSMGMGIRLPKGGVF